MRSHLAVLALSMLVGGGARAEIVTIAWDAQGRFTHRAELAAGKGVEVCGRLSPAARVRWQFKAGAPLDFNIHYHLGKDVAYAAKAKNKLQAADTLRPSSTQDYCWMWTHPGRGVTRLELSLRR